jgi:serine/threonine protein kinase
MSTPFTLLGAGTLVQDRYRIKHLVGKGGMGAVYETRDERLGHYLALKQNFYGADEQLKRAFEREARLLANLRHTALPRVTDYFTESFGQCLVMEFVPGHDLLAQLKQNGCSFPVEKVIVWADQVLDALEYLHNQQPPIIHRDVKPQNLKLNVDGGIMLLDFGLAKGTTSGLTSVMAGSSIVGYTPGYAPLEQITGKGTDARSDLYSLAATLYHLLTNQAPPDALQRMGATTNDEPDPLQPAAELNRLIPSALSSVLGKALAQKRNDRFESAKAMRLALKQCVVENEETFVRLPQPTPPKPTPAHDASTPKGPSAKPKPLVIEVPSPVPPRIVDVRPQSEPQKMPAKSWAVLVTALYFLAIVAVMWPLLLIAFWPLPGQTEEAIKMSGWPFFNGFFSAWLYWVILAVLVLSQFILLTVRVGVANQRPIKRRSVLWPIIVTGLMIGGLVMGAVVSIYEFITHDVELRTGIYVIYAVGGLTWALWSAIFYRLSQSENPGDVISRQCGYLLKGSILELLIAVPTHIVARSRDYCCAGFLTFFGISMGIAVMLFSFGPGVFFLFVNRWKRLHKYREPVDGPAAKET